MGEVVLCVVMVVVLGVVVREVVGTCEVVVGSPSKKSL